MDVRQPEAKPPTADLDPTIIRGPIAVECFFPDGEPDLSGPPCHPCVSVMSSAEKSELKARTVPCNAIRRHGDQYFMIDVAIVHGHGSAGNELVEFNGSDMYAFDDGIQRKYISLSSIVERSQLG